MDFICSLPNSGHGQDAVWAIVDRLIKSAHFILVSMKYKVDKLTELYIEEVVKMHGVPSNVVSEKGSEVCIESLGELHEA